KTTTCKPLSPLVTPCVPGSGCVLYAFTSESASAFFKKHPAMQCSVLSAVTIQDDIMVKKRA
ncbi:MULTISPECIES: hypothetical protein, partial [Cobetia]|uniref:hypothetical protein n=1 Tax=Cobetia TaxID=204286 RepID=UPI001C714E02